MTHVFKFAFILIVVGVICSIGVALVYVAAREPIEANRKAMVEGGLADVFGPEAAIEEISGEADDMQMVWKATGPGGDLLGYAAIGQAQGYSSMLKALTGVSADFETIVAVRVLEQQETPGLGAAVAEKPARQTLFQAITGLFGGGDDGAEPQPFSAFEQQYLGKPLERCVVVTAGSPNARESIEAITAATITSEAANAAILRAVERMRRVVGGGAE